MMFMITSDQEKKAIQEYQNCWPSYCKYYHSYLTSVLVHPYLCRLFQNYWSDRFSCFLIVLAFSILMLHFLPWCCIFYLDVAVSTLMLHFQSWCCIFHRDDIFNTLALHFLPEWRFWHFLLWYSIFYFGGIF